jgi:hypothetical protein
VGEFRRERFFPFPFVRKHIDQAISAAGFSKNKLPDIQNDSGPFQERVYAIHSLGCEAVPNFLEI